MMSHEFEAALCRHHKLALMKSMECLANLMGCLAEKGSMFFLNVYNKLYVVIQTKNIKKNKNKN